MDKATILNNGLPMPMVGVGTFQVTDGSEAEQVVRWALEIGYRSVDTAKIYGNEESVGRGIKSSGLPREQIFITTKLWNVDQGYDTTLRAIDESLQKLGLDYVDLYLIHWPIATRLSLAKPTDGNKREETWKAMEEIYKLGKAKAIGVSNYTLKHLGEMEHYASVPPMVNQVEFHPFLYQKDLLDYCMGHKIVLEAYRPLGNGEKLDNPIITEIAEGRGKTAAQVMLRWAIQHGCPVIPKSVHRERLEENFDVLSFDLSSEEMRQLDSLNQNLRTNHDPHQWVQ